MIYLNEHPFAEARRILVPRSIKFKAKWDNAYHVPRTSGVGSGIQLNTVECVINPKANIQKALMSHYQHNPRGRNIPGLALSALSNEEAATQTAHNNNEETEKKNLH